MYFHGSSKSKNGKNNKNISNNKLENIKSTKILKQIFNILQKRKQLEMVKYNKKNKARLNLTIKDYDEYFKLEIELIPELNKYGQLINLSEEDKDEFYHMYFNNNKEEEKRYFLNFNDKGKIKLMIDFPVKSFYKLFYCCSCINSICFKNFFKK